jgi:hypothetical protein
MRAGLVVDEAGVEVAVRQWSTAADEVREVTIAADAPLVATALRATETAAAVEGLCDLLTRAARAYADHLEWLAENARRTADGYLAADLAVAASLDVLTGAAW